jgi:hypothetical protein
LGNPRGKIPVNSSARDPAIAGGGTENAMQTMIDCGGATGVPRLVLRLEGAALAAAATLVFTHAGYSWWLFAAFILAPDLSMAGYLGGPKIGAGIYNAAHSTLAPIALGLLGFWLDLPAARAVALVWLIHIGIDRALGYGLKSAAGFGFTHLGPIGRRSAGQI